MKWLLLSMCLLAVGCARREGDRGPAGADGSAGLTGAQGKQGLPGLNGTNATIDVIRLCPNISGSYPEVMWRTGGKIYAVYDLTTQVRLVEVVAGNYVTTDGRNCYFTVHADATVTW